MRILRTVFRIVKSFFEIALLGSVFDKKACANLSRSFLYCKKIFRNCFTRGRFWTRRPVRICRAVFRIVKKFFEIALLGEVFDKKACANLSRSFWHCKKVFRNCFTRGGI